MTGEKIRAALRVASVALIGLGLAGCVSSGSDPASTPSPASVTRTPADPRTQGLVGNWGVASYRDDKDRARTEAQARAQCRLPYVIARGPTDGVMLHFADDPKLYELKLKSAPDGKLYLGFEAPPGDWQDREVLSLSDNLFVTRFVDPEIHARYGTVVYVRCRG